MQPESVRREMTCPFNGKSCVNGIRNDFEKDADGRLHECRWWVHMYGKDPQSEKIYDQYDCSLPWLTITTVEQSQMSRMNTASTDKVANEVHALTSRLQASFADMVNAFLALAERNNELLEFKRNEPTTIEVPPNGKGEPHGN